MTFGEWDGEGLAFPISSGCQIIIGKHTTNTTNTTPANTYALTGTPATAPKNTEDSTQRVKQRRMFKEDIE